MDKGGPTKGRVLLVDDDASERVELASGLRETGYEVVEAVGCGDARRALFLRKPDIVFTDLRLGDGDVFELLPFFRAVDPSLPVFILTGHGTIGAAVRAVKAGAQDFLTKPVSRSFVHEIVENAVAQRVAERPASRGSNGGTSPLRSPAMRTLEEQVERLRDADCAVLILGETGTGKSVLARRLHAIGARSKGPFVDVNCAGLSKELVESELFGHERGAFTGAHALKSGLFDVANGGTLFLDEIGDIDLQVQPKLLKVLEEKRFRRMGDVRERNVDIRLVAATHQNLLDARARETFRADLYYRISTVTLTVPALRDRREDILPLTAELLARLVVGGRVELERDAAEKLLEHAWPGNIRELKNVLERAVILRSGHAITAADIRFDMSPTFSPVHPGAVTSSRLLAANASTATRDEIEREHICLALEAENGRVEAAARRLGIPRSTLYWKLKRSGMNPTRPRSKRTGS